MKRFRLCLLGLFALAVAACVTVQVRKSLAQVPPAATKTATSNDEAEIKALLDRYAVALRVKDIDGAMAVYEPGVVAFDLVPPLQYTGKEAYKADFQKFFDEIKAPIEFEIRGLSITAGGDVAFSHCMERIGGTTKAGERTELWVRVTAGYRKIDGKWRIAHDHVSVPIDMETGKAELELKP